MAHHRVQDVRSEVKEGDQILVKVVNIDPSGKIRLSRKALLEGGEGASGQGGPGGGGGQGEPQPAGAYSDRRSHDQHRSHGDRGHRPDRDRGRGGDRGGRDHGDRRPR
jgi:polyribonucleotide nucleotidyltransferase